MKILVFVFINLSSIHVGHLQTASTCMPPGNPHVDITGGLSEFLRKPTKVPHQFNSQSWLPCITYLFYDDIVDDNNKAVLPIGLTCIL